MESCSHIVPGLGKALGTIQNIVEKVRFGTAFCQNRPIGQIEVPLTTPYDGFKRALPWFEPDTFPREVALID